ncbi:hypothetical protein LRAMOSA11497 [Lichtheimia ramosa]|uniref:RNA-directed DNA polymerase n=2 Tax=Lichtheimia ramosa TaxID=688394 RepID=A0A077X0L6_9FUNG|nr:hypothetical protein LRAMOSA11497 [Lichtheimia ramosa]
MPFVKPVKYKKGDDLTIWVRLYDRVAEMNKWSDKDRIQKCALYLPSELRDWSLYQTHATWDAFADALLDRFARKQSIKSIVDKIMNLRMKGEGASALREYVRKFERLTGKYHIAHAEAQLQQSQSDPTSRRVSQGPVISLDEASLVSIFLQSLKPVSLRYALASQHLPNLKDAISEAQNLVEGATADSSDESTDSGSDTSGSSDDSSSSDESDSDADTPVHKHKRRKSKYRHRDDKELHDTVSKLATEVAKLKTTINKQKDHTSSEPISKTGITCYNCRQPGHSAPACKSPCKYCSGAHKYYDCPQHPKNAKKASKVAKDTTDTTPPTTAMLIQSDNDHESCCEDMYAIRGRNEDDEGDQPRSRRRVDDIVSHDHQVSVTNAQNNMHDTVTNHGQPPMEIDPLLSQADHANTASNVQGASDKNRIQLADAALTAKELVNRPVYQVSLAQLADIAPSFRTQAKSALTKPHRKDHGSSTMLQVETNDLDSQPQVPLGESAPRSIGLVNGKTVNMILDGGCVPCIVSTNLASALNLVIGPDSTPLTFGDGSGKRAPIVQSQVSISVGPSKTVNVRTLCLDVPSYDFVVGREAFSLLGIGTDWSHHFWYTMSSHGYMPLSVQYTPIPRANMVKRSHDKGHMHESEEAEEGSEMAFLLCMDDTSEFDVFDGNEMIGPTSHMMIDKEKPDDFQAMISSIQARQDLLPEDKNALLSVLIKHKGCFGSSYADVTQTDLVTFHVDTGDARPIYKRPYPHMSHSELQCLKQELETMVSNGILVPAMHARYNSRNGGWSFPCRYVAKKDGSRRLVTQFQDLNKVTVRDPWPLPSIQDLLEQFTGSSLFSTMDLLKGFHQIAVDPASIPKLTITTPFGCYSYRVMPFGVINGPSCFSRAIHLALEPFLYRCAVAYIDDVTVYSKTMHDHLGHLDAVLSRLEEVNMKCSSKKCDFVKSRIEFLGFVVSSSGIIPHPARIQQIQDFPRPSNPTEVRGFLGLSNFYRRHVQLFADVAEPLVAVTKKKARFTWGEKQEQALDYLKQALSKSILLVFPDPNKPYNVFTDASDVGLGVVLSQFDDNNDDRPICFLSRKLKPAEVRYPVVERELLAVIYALQKLRRFLLDKTFTLFTDNSAVRYLFAKSDPNMRLQRWILATQEFSFQVKHIPGKSNVVADVLSRYPPKEDPSEESGEDLLTAMYDHLLIQGPVYEQQLQPIFEYLAKPWDQTVDTRVKIKSMQYRVNDDHLYRKIGSRWVRVPFIGQERLDVLRQIHDGHGHFGINASWARLYHSYWWPNVFQQLKDFIKTCKECQLFAPVSKPHATRKVPVYRLFQRFALDYVGPLPETSAGNRYLLVGVECYSNWPLARAFKSPSAENVSTFIYEDICSQFGPPLEILSDNGSAFIQTGIEIALDKLGTKHLYTAPYRPQTNGRCEHLNGVIMSSLRKLTYEHPTEWDLHVPSVLFSYRTKSHESLGISPFELLYGQAVNVPTDDILLQLGRLLAGARLIQKQQQNMMMEETAIDARVKEYMSNHQEPSPYVKYPSGTVVMRVRHASRTKMDTAYIPQPLIVIAGFANRTYQLADEQGRLLKRRVNEDSLRCFHDRKDFLSRFIHD